MVEIAFIVSCLSFAVKISNRPGHKHGKEVRMKIWLPDRVYKSFPMVVSSIGVLGCFAGSAASLSLGGVLLLYGTGVMCLRMK